MHTASEEDAERLVSLLYNLTKCVRIPQIPLDSPAADVGDPSSSLPHPPPPTGVTTGHAMWMPTSGMLQTHGSITASGPRPVQWTPLENPPYSQTG